ncbi:hypothetical protein ACFYW9_19315 [Streptomyces sp. NPDC002698]|uniref:hypothetical protein n=1 Tax=Streptomyces sp. NPDC002698 TaxID=3364660 RepID=UPI00369A34D6
MAFVTIDDVVARLGRPVADEAEATRITAFIEDATGLVCDYCRTDFQPPKWSVVPAAVKAAVCSEVIRWLSVSPGTVMEKTGDLEVQYAATAYNSGLSEAAKSMLCRYRRTAVAVSLHICWGDECCSTTE